MIDDILSGLLGGYLADRLARQVRPKRTSDFDHMSIDELGLRNNWIDVAGTLIGVGSFCLMFLLLVNLGPPDVWRLGLVFCFPATLQLLFVCIVTLPKGTGRLREFWRFHELKHRIRLALLLSMYIPLAAIGAISAFKVFLNAAKVFFNAA